MMPTQADILQTILLRKQAEVEALLATRSLATLRNQAADQAPCRGFARAMQSKQQSGAAAVIAEVKKASPSKGLLRDLFEPAAIAKSYELGGATCLSVLTDVDFFQGHDDYLRQARAACSLPVIRKDFVIDASQIYHARCVGADCVLLIVSALKDSRLPEFCELTQALGMDALIEVHDAEEMQRALACRSTLIGVNNRNLRTFETDLDLSLALFAANASHFTAKLGANPARIFVTESGIQTKADVQRMRAAGIDSFLIGETFMRAADPGTALRELFA